jgi:sporulation protein YlmC with PRC-barrel domain
MLLAVSALKGYAIEASDGTLGTVSDLLFDDRTWNVRWLVVNTGNWMTGRKVLIHPSAIGEADYDRQQLPIRLTKVQITQGPEILDVQPVSKQLEDHLYHHHGWDPHWGRRSFFAAGASGAPASPQMALAGAAVGEAAEIESRLNDGDPHLQSTAAFVGYRIQANDGEIGHVENVLFDDVRWEVRYLVIDTQNWWLGKHVLVSPYSVREIEWSDKHIRLDLGREQIKDSPPWDPEEIIDQAYEEKLHSHYGWRGYGW